MTSHKIVKIAEDICKLGCSRVNEIIKEIEQGESLEETTSLDESETSSLLHELKSIMAVYNNKK